MGKDSIVRNVFPDALGRLVGRVSRRFASAATERSFIRKLPELDAVHLWSNFSPGCLERLKTVAGPIDSNPPHVKPGEGIGHYEAPRGEVFHYIRSDGSNRPVRHKVRAPSFMNVPTNCVTVPGATVADATIILAAVDPCYCCTERMATAFDRNSGTHLWDGGDLIRLSKEKTERLKSETGLQEPQLRLE